MRRNGLRDRLLYDLIHGLVNRLMHRLMYRVPSRKVRLINAFWVMQESIEAKTFERVAPWEWSELRCIVCCMDVQLSRKSAYNNPQGGRHYRKLQYPIRSYR